MSTLVELLKDLSKNTKQYTVDDNCNVITDRFDFTKKEDLDKLKETVNDLKNTLSYYVENPEIFKSFINRGCTNILYFIING